MGLVDGLWIWHTHTYEQTSIARGWEGIIRQEKRHNKRKHGLVRTLRLKEGMKPVEATDLFSL